MWNFQPELTNVDMTGMDNKQQRSAKKKELKTKVMDQMAAAFPEPIDDPFPVVDELALNHWIYPSI